MKKFFRGYKNIMFHGKLLDRIVSWAIVILLILILAGAVRSIFVKEVTEIPASVFLSELDNDNISKMDVCHTDGSVSGEFREEVDGYKKFTTIVPANSNALTEVYLDELNKSRQVEKENYDVIEYSFSKPSQLGTLLLTIVTFVVEFAVIILLFGWILKRNGGGGILSMGNVGSDINAKIPDVSFDDVAGVPEAIEEVSEIVTFLKNPSTYNKVGAKFPKGILLQGTEGTGKTLLARALAGEAGVPFIHASGSDFVEMYVGVGAKRVRALFDKAKKVAPSILFIDEIDAVGTDRDSGNFASSEHLQTINALLSEMDGFDNKDEVIVIAATNRADSLDKALIRPGRFDRIITVDTPAKEGRMDILRLYAQDKTFAEDIDFDKLAAHTYGFSGAQLENVMNQAATLAARRATDEGGEPAITMKDLDEGISRTISGPAMKSKQLDDEEKRLTAYHEASHAVVQYLLPGCDEVQKISIVSRNIPGVGLALGYVQSYNEDDSYITTADKCRDELAALLAGRCGEELFCNIESAGASNDLMTASSLAYDMVDKFAFREGTNGDYIHSFKVQVRDRRTSMIKVSNERQAIIDNNIHIILDRAYSKAKNILETNTDKIEKIVEKLFEQETIDADEIKAIMEE